MAARRTLRRAAGAMPPPVLLQTRPLLLRLLLMLLSPAAVLLAGPAQALGDYCELCSDHTMCGAKSPGPKCGNDLQPGINASERQHILHLHNELRSQVAQGREKRGKPGPQPSGSNLLRLAWNDELATFAQQWAEQCIFKHDTCRTTKDFPWVAQNLGMLAWTGRKPDSYGWKKVVYSWYDEVELLNSAIVPSYQFSTKTGHYSALVWADTRTVGCGSASSSDGGKTKQIFVCNYAPGGNLIRQPIYRGGPARSACPSTAVVSDPAYPGLCA